MAKPGYWKGRKDNPVYGYQKGRRGTLSGRSKPVITPAGAFGSLRLACDAFGLSMWKGWKLVTRGAQGYDTGWDYL